MFAITGEDPDLDRRWRNAKDTVRSYEDVMWRAEPGNPRHWKAGMKLLSKDGSEVIWMHYAMVRKAGSKSTQVLMEELARLSKLDGDLPKDLVKDRRRVTFTVARHPYAKLISGYGEVEKHLAHACRGQAEPEPMCSAPFTRLKRTYGHERKRFEQFAEDFVEGDAMAEGSALMYHVHSVTHSIAHLPDPIDYVAHLETYDADMREFLSEYFDLDKLLNQSAVLRSVLKADVDPRRWQPGLQTELAADAVSPKTRALADKFYAQDVACFGYDMGNVTDLEWHKAAREGKRPKPVVVAHRAGRPG